MLGIRPTWEGLLIDPAPFAELGEVSVTRRWRGRSVRVQFDAAGFVASVPPRLKLNGRVLESNVLSERDLSDVEVNEVVVEWGVVTTRRPAALDAVQRSRP